MREKEDNNNERERDYEGVENRLCKRIIHCIEDVLRIYPNKVQRIEQNMVEQRGQITQTKK